MTAALEGGEWSASRPSCTLPLGETWYPLYRRLGGPQGHSGQAENPVPTGIRSRTVQPVVTRYTDWATGPSVLCILTHTDITAELPVSGLTVMASRPVVQKVRTIVFFFESRLHWRFEVRLLLFTVCTCVWRSRPRLIWGSKSHNTVLHLIH